MLDVAALYASHWQRVARYFQVRLGGDWSIADDLASEVFARAWKARASYVDRSRPMPWLYRIAHNLLIDYREKAARTRWVSLDQLAQAGRAPGYTLRWDDLETRLVVREAIGRLPERQKAVIVGRFYEGRSLREVAGAGSPDAVKSAQRRGVAALKRGLEDGDV